MTLGKRIAAQRKRLGLTQDQLAEKLGVTPQAVSKWENDQSCPDISMLPKLAELFGTTTDALLGREEPARQAEPVTEGEWEPWIHGRRSTLCFAALVLLVGGLMLAGTLLGWDVSFWGILWPSAILMLGINGLLGRFSFFSLGCILFGGYFLLENLDVLDFNLGGNLIFATVLLLFGLTLLMDALRRPQKFKFAGAQHKPSRNHYEVSGDGFDFSGSFGEQRQLVSMPRLSRGTVSVSFGDYELDFTDVKELSKGCCIEVKCSFGELILMVPRRFQVKCDGSTAFASIETIGAPEEPVGTILLQASASFGEIKIRYI